MLTKEYQFKESAHTQENVMVTKNDMSADRLDLLKDSGRSNNEDGASLSDDVKYLKPLSKLMNISKVPIADIKWVMNDLFIMVISAKNEVAIVDGMLYAYGLQTRLGNFDALKVQLGKGIAKLEEEDRTFKVKGFEMSLDASTAIIKPNKNPFIVLINKATNIRLMQLENPCAPLENPYQKMDAQLLARLHLQVKRVNHVYHLLSSDSLVLDPEIWLSCTIQLVSYCLRYSA
jgi:hypothetical protein